MEQIEFIRTPPERFENLPGYNFKENYMQVNPGNLRMHYLDENASSRKIVLMLHGEPSWSYLYRKMIPIFVQAGYRAIAPDLIGFGKSDKPKDRFVFSYSIHIEWLNHFIKEMKLSNINLICQDWGGLLGLRIAAENKSLFHSIIAGNTFLPTGDNKLPDAFYEWRNFSQNVKRLPVGRIIKNGCYTNISSEIVNAYDAPFPDESYKEAARIFPSLVPDSPDNPASEANKKAWEIFSNWNIPFLTAFSDQDPIMRKVDIFFRRKVLGAKGQPHTTIKGAGHFLQEDSGEDLADVSVKWLNSLYK
ncbi:MAG: haloalkane dehalogenase [Leptospira sp.]|nr:haloalkane dehalogenase [Leptospira sp.]NCS95041.1 haloalkane dehalogenase [Leptospira sp.]